MMRKDHSFFNVQDAATLGRIARAAEIKILNRFEYFEAVNSKNGHKYKVEVSGLDIICSCPDAKNNNCKHEIAVARDMSIFEDETEKAYRLAEASFEEDWHEKRYQGGL